MKRLQYKKLALGLAIIIFITVICALTAYMTDKSSKYYYFSERLGIMTNTKNSFYDGYTENTELGDDWLMTDFSYSTISENGELSGFIRISFELTYNGSLPFNENFVSTEEEQSKTGAVTKLSFGLYDTAGKHIDGVIPDSEGSYMGGKTLRFNRIYDLQGKGKAFSLKSSNGLVYSFILENEHKGYSAFKKLGKCCDTGKGAYLVIIPGAKDGVNGNYISLINDGTAYKNINFTGPVTFVNSDNTKNDVELTPVPTGINLAFTTTDLLNAKEIIFDAEVGIEAKELIPISSDSIGKRFVLPNSDSGLVVNDIEITQVGDKKNVKITYTVDDDLINRNVCLITLSNGQENSMTMKNGDYADIATFTKHTDTPTESDYISCSCNTVSITFTSR